MDCNSHPSCSMSLVWKKKNIIKIFPLFSPHTRFFIGNGRSIKFLKDLWWGNHPLSNVFPRVFRIFVYKDAFVADVLSPSSNGLNWNLPLSRDLFEWRVVLWSNLFSSLNGVYISNVIPDKRVWTLEFSDQFSSKSFLISFLNVSSHSYLFPFKRIWSPLIPPRVKEFVWTASLERMNTLDMVQRRPSMTLSPNWCVLCNANRKSANHIFIHCAYAKNIWNYFMERLHRSWVMPKKIMELLCQWTSWGMSLHGRSFGNVWFTIYYKEYGKREMAGYLKGEIKVIGSLWTLY